jgi:prepilin-type N-terminal cleavage/methylation domain-containing protein
MKMRIHKQSGFTLIEVLLVCGIIGVISAMALPRLLMAKQAADSSSAIGSLRTMDSSELGFSASCGGGYYSPDLTTLAVVPPGTNSPFISPDLSYANSPVKSGYTFQLTGTPDAAAPATCNGLAAGSASMSFKAGADPTVPSNYRFFATNSGNTIYEDSSTLYAAMPESGAPPTGHPLDK